jgi:hypothetical protein
MRTRGSVMGVVLLAAGAFGCTSAVPPSTATSSTTAPDVDRLAGKWRGWWTDASGGSVALEVDARPDGTYVSRAGTTNGSGTFRVVDGRILTSGHLAGPDAPVSGRTSIITISERRGRPVLAGKGRSSAGPFSFELTKE